jgi:alkanesulfonate monooxygenase SsuD/methylene tetrahydromethanopterin reductase-like flavin-dependent oxidoreductase (luciferase family)
MSEAVPDEVVDAIAIAGRPDEVRDRLREWEGLTDHPLLYPPTAGVSSERVRENLAAITDTFGARRAG